MINPRLKLLKAKNFRSFKEMEVSFPEAGLLLLQGKNLDSNGSSRSGKSSINTAIQYAMGQASLSGNQLQSWFAKDGLSVSLEITQGEASAILNKSTKSFFKTPQATTTGAKPISEALDTFLGISADTLANLTFRAQKSKGFFLSKTDAEKKEFLSTILGFNKIEEAIENSEKLSTSLNKQAEFDGVRLTAAQAYAEEARKNIPAKPTDLILNDLTPYQAALESLKEEALKAKTAHETKVSEQTALTKSLQERARDLLKERFAAPEPTPPEIEADLSEIERLETLIAEGNRRLKLAVEAEELRRKEFDASKKKLELQARDLASAPTKLKNVQEKQDLAERQLASLEAATCPTCEQHWNSPDKILATKRTIGACVLDIAELQEQIKQLSALHSELEILVWQPNTSVIDQLREAVANWSTEKGIESRKIDDSKKDAFKSYMLAKATYDTERRNTESAIQAELSQGLQSIQEEVGLALANRSKAESAVVSARQVLDSELQKNKDALAEHERLEKAFKENTTRFHEKQAQAQELELAVQQTKAQLDAELDFQDCIGRTGFLGLVFEEILAEISDGTNEILRYIPNVDDVTIEFASEAVTAKGTVKKSIKTQMKSGNYEATFDGLSGGQQTAVELAVDLALLDVVSNRSGLVPGWLILDESFEGLDLVSKEACLEILKKKSDNRLIIVVDHSNEFKEMFNQIIEVNYKDGISTIGDT